MNTPQWFILREGREEGPFTALEVRRMIDNCAIDWSTLAHTEGMPDWTALQDTPIRAAWKSDNWCFGIGGIALSLAIVWGLFASDIRSTRIALFAVASVFYFIPWLVAIRARHHNVTAIAALNILLGWTVIGWAVALVWALTKPAKMVS